MELDPTNYLGLTKFSKTLNNYHLSLTHHYSDIDIPNHHHQNPYFSLNLRCPYLEQHKESKKVIEPGQLLMRPAYYEHKNTFLKSNGLCFNIELTNNKLNFENSLIDNHNLSVIPLLKVLTGSINNVPDDELDCLISEALLFRLEDRLKVRYPKWYKIIVDKINEDYTENLSLGNLADIVGIHPNYLARKFKMIHGSTIGEFIRQVRIQNATVNIFSNKKLTQVALENGFYDQAHFCKSFLSTYNIKPKKLQFLGKG